MKGEDEKGEAEDEEEGEAGMSGEVLGEGGETEVGGC